MAPPTSVPPTPTATPFRKSRRVISRCIPSSRSLTFSVMRSLLSSLSARLYNAVPAQQTFQAGFGFGLNLGNLWRRSQCGSCLRVHGVPYFRDSNGGAHRAGGALGNLMKEAQNTRGVWPYLALLAGMACIAWSAIFVRWTDMPGPASAFYRLL